MEVDFIIDLGNRQLALIEAKATRTPTPDNARPMLKLNRSIKDYQVQRYLIHRPTTGKPSLSTLCRGVKALTAKQLGQIWR